MQLTRTCSLMGMAQDGVQCTCVFVPPVDAGDVDAGVCNQALLSQVCPALGKDADPAACVCRDRPPDGGYDAGPGGCRVDGDCAGGEFCCGLHCYPTNANTVNGHCGCIPGIPGDTGVDCSTAYYGRRCVGASNTLLDSLDAGVRGLLAGAVCGCGDNGVAAVDCGFASNGLAGVCNDHRCLPQSDQACGFPVTACSGLAGGRHCAPLAPSGAGVCACDVNNIDIVAECPSYSPLFRSASRCAPAPDGGALRPPWGTCMCGGSDAGSCTGSAASACCPSGPSNSACVNTTTNNGNCGMCGMTCADATNRACAFRVGGFASCAAQQYSDTQCYTGTFNNPHSNANAARLTPTGSVYACTCSSFRFSGDDSACPSGYNCCPSGSSSSSGGGCCLSDCATPFALNRCTTFWPPDGGVWP